MTLRSEEIEHLVFMATHAPSVHNTQPWRFTATPSSLVLSQDTNRQVHVIDPWGRELLMSCGAALDHLEVAARAIGLDAAVVLCVEGNTVAEIHFTRGAEATTVEVDRAIAILERHTNRGRFSGPALTDDVLDAVRSRAQQHDTLVRVVDASEITEVEVLLSRAEDRLLRSADYLRELDRWVWHGSINDHRGNGLPQPAVQHGINRAESLTGREFNGTRLVRPSEPPAAEEQTVVLLTTMADTRRDWIQSGRALSAVLLTVTIKGLVAQPLGQVVDLSGARKALSDLLGTIGSPQMLLRIGHGPSLPATPRRSVSDVLTVSSVGAPHV